MVTGAIDPADNGNCPTEGGATEEVRTASCGSTWLLQGDAAARTGFSVSAIRKWRRMGLVAERKVAAPGGVERVEVKLEDVLARAALHPERQATEHPPAPTESDAMEKLPFQPGRIVVTIEDLESLFERMVDAERRAVQAEAQVASLQGQARFMYGQLSELRRQLEAATGKDADGATARQTAGTEPAGRGPSAVAPRVPRTEKVGDVSAQCPKAPAAEAAAPNGAMRPVRVPGNGQSPEIQTVARPSRPAVVARDESNVEELVHRLRQVYSRLDEFRRQEVVTPEVERERLRTLAAYDRRLLAVCAALGIATGLADGEPVTVEARAALTRALAKVGFDVRAAVKQPPGQKVRRIRSGLRP